MEGKSVGLQNNSHRGKDGLKTKRVLEKVERNEKGYQEGRSRK